MRNRSIVDLFTKSPFRKIQAHMKKVSLCAQQLYLLFQAVCDEDINKIQKTCYFLDQSAHEANWLQNEIMTHLPKSLLLPVARGDLLELIQMQAGIATSANELAKLMTLKTLRLPEELKSEALHFMNSVVVACEFASEIIAEMEGLIMASFEGPLADEVLMRINQLNHFHKKNESLEHEFVCKLFVIRDKLETADLLLWHQIFHAVGKTANYADKIGNQMRLLIAHV